MTLSVRVVCWFMLKSAGGRRVAPTPTAHKKLAILGRNS